MISKTGVCAMTMCLLNALSSVCGASVYSVRLRPIDLNPRSQDFSKGLDASTIQPIQSLNGLKSADVQKIIPTDLDPNDQSGVGKRIVNNTVNNMMKSDAIRNSSIGSTIHSAQQSMQTNISIGGGGASGESGARSQAAASNANTSNTAPAANESLNRAPTSVRHEFKLAADPMQTLARINYTGLAKAELSYRASESKMDFEMRKPVSALATDVVYNHTDQPGDRRDLMSLRWAW